MSSSSQFKWFRQEDRLRMTLTCGAWLRDILTSGADLDARDCCDFDMFYCSAYPRGSGKDNGLMLGFEI